jgi:hypothetical protein
MCQSSFTIYFSSLICHFSCDFVGCTLCFSTIILFPEEILSQPLWLNSEIEIGGKPVLYQRWAKADVFFINDLLKNEGGFLNLEQFQDKYGPDASK